MEKKYAVGIDIGAQSAKIGIVDAGGKVIDRKVIVSNDTPDYNVFIKALSEAVLQLLSDNGLSGCVCGVGVGAPNANYYDGTIGYAPNLTWGNIPSFPFAELLSKALGGLKVTLTNDANAAAMGEMTYGAAKGMKDFIEITLGTGVGSGIIIDGKLVYGHNGFAGELGHVCVVPQGRLCGCGKKGCLEAYCNASGVVKTAKELLEQTDEPSLLRGKPFNSPKEIGEAAEQGDGLAKKVFETMGRTLGRAFADFVAFSAPEAIVVFGGIAASRKFFEEAMKEEMDENLLPMWKGKVKILFSALPASDAAILGASSLAW